MQITYQIPNNLYEIESIQGGKINHIFEINNNLYTSTFSSQEAKEALTNGIWTVKFHGSNGFISKKNGELIIWERRDIKNKKLEDYKHLGRILSLETINLDNNYTKCELPLEYKSNEKQHKYIFIEVLKSSKMGKKDCILE